MCVCVYRCIFSSTVSRVDFLVKNERSTDFFHGVYTSTKFFTVHHTQNPVEKSLWLCQCILIRLGFDTKSYEIDLM